MLTKRMTKRVKRKHSRKQKSKKGGNATDYETNHKNCKSGFPSNITTCPHASYQYDFPGFFRRNNLFSDNQAIKKLDIDVAKKFFKEQYLKDKGGIDEEFYDENTGKWYDYFDEQFDEWFNTVQPIKDVTNPVTREQKDLFMKRIKIFRPQLKPQPQLAQLPIEKKSKGWFSG